MPVIFSDKVFVAAYPMISQDKFGIALHGLCKEIGVPGNLNGGFSWDRTYIKLKILFDQVGMIPNIF